MSLCSSSCVDCLVGRPCVIRERARAEALQSKGEEVTHHLGVAMMDARLLTAKVEALQAERDEAVELLRLYCPPRQHEQAIAEFLDRIDAKRKP